MRTYDLREAVFAAPDLFLTRHLDMVMITTGMQADGDFVFLECNGRHLVALHRGSGKLVWSLKSMINSLRGRYAHLEAKTLSTKAGNPADQPAIQLVRAPR